VIAYFDSSAFVKLLIPEEGSDEARRLFAGATQVFSSRLLVPETSAALARARRMGRLAARASDSALAAGRALLGGVSPLEVVPAVAEAAARQAEIHGLRAYDAVHLASYQRVESPTSVLVAADGDLVKVAQSLGYSVAVPA
jgi:predicted nucleic acid-binding protein